MNDEEKKFFLRRLAIIAVVLFLVFAVMRGASNNATNATRAHYLPYSEFLNEVHNQNVAVVTIHDTLVAPIITGKTRDNKTFVTTGTTLDRGLMGDLIASGAIINVIKPEDQPLLTTILISWVPMLLLIGVWIYFMRQSQGGAGGRNAFTFGKSRARMVENPSVTFADVAGCDEAKEEVKEMVDFLRDPTKFHNLGGRIPRGALFVGPPGTGKTLLAKAIAGEARVPFFSISGSDFVEMFVGVGAARVRDMFETAKKHAPCIIFIDEIDAVGRQRGAGLGGGNDEREQTLNQMLVEMDGFETSTAVIVIAATNRPDILDPALLRPGRFDRQVVVPLPDIRGREQILLVHLRKKPIDGDPKQIASVVARGTPGFSGADLANLVNEATLIAGRRKATRITLEDFEHAKDKIMMGPERRTMIMSEEERRNTAYHESGHAVVAKLLPKTDPVHKVSIIPRGRALGVTMQLPERDRFTYDREYLLNRIAVLFGGRIAEELFMGQMTTGASNDFERATQLARDMVTRFGMSDVLGPMIYAENEGEVFLGRSITKTTHISEDTMKKVDAEIRRIIDEQYALAKKLLEKHSDKVEAMARALLELETIDAEQIDDIMAGKPPRLHKENVPSAPLQTDEANPDTPHENGRSGIAPGSKDIARDVGLDPD